MEQEITTIINAQHFYRNYLIERKETSEREIIWGGITEETTEEMSGYAPQPLKAFKGAIVMLISYSLAGLIPLAPYAFIQDNTAVIVSVIVSLIGLFGLGIGTSIFYHRPRPWVRGLKMVVLGGIAVLFGMLVGNLVHLRVQ